MQGTCVYESARSIQTAQQQGTAMPQTSVSLKQSAYGFHELISGWLKDHGFKNLDTDGVTIMKDVKKADGTTSKIILIIHVNDAIVAINDDQFYAEFLTELGKDFELSDSGNLNGFLGCKVEQDLKNGTVRMSQEKYCKNADGGSSPAYPTK